MNRREMLCASTGAAAILIGGVQQAAAKTVKLKVTSRDTCGTCQFWGGERTVSSNGRWVEAVGVGICSNPESPAYRKETRPDQGAPVWRKWEKLA